MSLRLVIAFVALGLVAAERAHACSPMKPKDWTDATPAQLCSAIEQIGEMPVKEGPLLVGDSLHDALRAKRAEVGGCLVERIADTARMPEPFCPRIVGEIAVGDFAFMLLSDLGYFAWEDILPSEWERDHPSGARVALYTWAAAQGNRARLQEATRNWIAAHPPDFSEPLKTVAEAARERDALVVARDYAGAISLTEELELSRGGNDDLFARIRIQLAWLSDTDAIPRPTFQALKPLSLLVLSTTRVSGADREAEIARASRMLAAAYREGRAGIAADERAASCWERVAEASEERDACLAIHDPTLR